MQTTTFFRNMGRNDAKIISRDQLMIGLAFYPVAIWAALRFGVRPLAGWLSTNYEFDLLPFSALMVSYGLAIMIPMFLGMVFGMLLIEEQDDNTLTAMMVTPVSLDAFVWYRAVAAATISFAMLLILLPATGLVDMPFWQAFVISLVATLNAPMTALLFFSLASNKIQAFGMLKVLSSLNVVPLLAWFVPEPWQYALGIYPPYWAVRAYWAAAEGQSFWLFFVPALVLYAIVFKILIDRFRAKAYSGAV